LGFPSFSSQAPHADYDLCCAIFPERLPQDRSQRVERFQTVAPSLGGFTEPKDAAVKTIVRAALRPQVRVARLPRISSDHWRNKLIAYR
jgi:hypothetical protein